MRSPALFQTCFALHGPFFPVRHNHGSRRSALPSRKELLRARQAVAPSPTLASEILTRKTNDAIVHHLRALEFDLAEAGEEVGRSAERVKRAVTAAEQPADREYLGEMLVSYTVVPECSLAGGSRAHPFVPPSPFVFFFFFFSTTPSTASSASSRRTLRSAPGRLSWTMLLDRHL